MDTEKRAIGVFNGWKCPYCKRLVSGPKDPVGPISGRCHFCKTVLIFEKVTAPENSYKVVFGIKPSNADSSAEHGDNNILCAASLRYPNLRENGDSWVVMNFSKRPNFLRVLERLAMDRNFSLSDVIVSFAARGYKDWVKSGGRVEKTGA